MAKRRKQNAPGAMLDYWRPPSGAGEAIGCLSTTYTFDPGLFDEQCLGRFLEVEADPNREDLAYLLERERCLGATYAGVLVDHTQSGVEHSLRWDVLPVRVSQAKQHAKLSLLAWQNHVRILVASANLTKPGYRSNQEVCVAIDSTPNEAQLDQLFDADDFLRKLLAFVPGAGPEAATVQRAITFLDQVRARVDTWQPAKRVKGQRQQLVFTLPGREGNPATGGPAFPRSSSLEVALSNCSSRGGAPNKIWIASPFFDTDAENDATTESLCKSMARGMPRTVRFGVTSIGEINHTALRLAAPPSLQKTAEKYGADVVVDVLPHEDDDGNLRPWHAKMVAMLRETGKPYTALMVGSSNFTRAGMGISGACNAEANLLTIAEHLPRARLPGQIMDIWPDITEVDDLSFVEWAGPTAELVEEQQAECVPAPAGFISATYQAGDHREVQIRLNADNLPEEWSIVATGDDEREIINSTRWKEQGCPDALSVSWQPIHAPERILIRWSGDGSAVNEAFLPLNVADAKALPAPAELSGMTADDMLLILAAVDPSAAFRVWAKQLQQEAAFDEELDAATPPDLDPLRRHDLQATFLCRIRNRARVLAQLRCNLQRPVWSKQALQWQLEGFIGIRSLAERLLREVLAPEHQLNEGLLTLADLVILLREVVYEPTEGAISTQDFAEVYEPFLFDLVEKLNRQVQVERHRTGHDVLGFWDRVVQRCQN